MQGQQQPPYWLVRIYQRLEALERFRVRVETTFGMGKILMKWGGPAIVFLFLIIGHEEKAKILVDLVK